MIAIGCFEEPLQLHSVLRRISPMGAHCSQDCCGCSRDSGQADVNTVASEQLEGSHHLLDHGRFYRGWALSGDSLRRRIEEI